MILWKNINLATLGIVVEKEPTITKAKKKIKTYEIDGRNGFLTVDSGTYESFNLNVECHLDMDKVNLDEIKYILDGYGTLSFDGEREYTAIVNNLIDFEKVALTFRNFIIKFKVNPIAKDINPTILSISNDYSFNIQDTYYNIYPIIKIKGEGNIQVTVNNQNFYLYDLQKNIEYLLDCENKVITANNSNASNQMKNDFPFLKKGVNNISYVGNVTSFFVEYKRSYL